MDPFKEIHNPEALLSYIRKFIDDNEIYDIDIIEDVIDSDTLFDFFTKVVELAGLSEVPQDIEQEMMEYEVDDEDY